MIFAGDEQQNDREERKKDDQTNANELSVLI